MSYPPPSHRGPRSDPPPRPRSATTGESYRSSRLRTSTRSGGPQRRVLQVDPPEGCGPPPEPTETAPEWLLVVRAVLSRERTALAVSVIAVAVAALVIVVIPVITGQMG